MEQPWRIGLAVAVITALVGGIVWFSVVGGGEVSTVAPAATTAVAGAAAPHAVVASTVPTTGGVQSALTTTASPQEVAVLHATDCALAAWGEFAVTGDLTLVEGTFVADGPQLEQLRNEAPALLSDPLGPPSYVFEIRDPVVKMKGMGEAIVSAPIVLTRIGEPPREFDWRIHLHQIGETWQLWTVDLVE